jgi:hypothetical protein
MAGLGLGFGFMDNFLGHEFTACQQPPGGRLRLGEPGLRHGFLGVGVGFGDEQCFGAAIRREARFARFDFRAQRGGLGLEAGQARRVAGEGETFGFGIEFDQHFAGLDAAAQFQPCVHHPAIDPGGYRMRGGRGFQAGFVRDFVNLDLPTREPRQPSAQQQAREPDAEGPRPCGVGIEGAPGAFERDRHGRGFDFCFCRSG